MADQRWANDYTRPYNASTAPIATNRFSHIISQSSPYAPGPGSAAPKVPQTPLYPPGTGTVWYQAAYAQPATLTPPTVIPAPVIQQAIERAQQAQQIAQRQVPQSPYTQASASTLVQHVEAPSESHTQAESTSPPVQSQPRSQEEYPSERQVPPQQTEYSPQPITREVDVQHSTSNAPSTSPQTSSHPQQRIESQNPPSHSQNQQRAHDTPTPQLESQQSFHQQQSLQVLEYPRPSVLPHSEPVSRRRQLTPPPPVEDEMLPPPPHDIDELAPVAVVRACTMAHHEISPILRCPMLLKADYKYRMCEYCRLRFRLAEIRARGKLHEGKANTGKRKIKKIGQKARPHLIEFNGELIIDPSYLHTFELDPRMFGPQGVADSLEAAEDVEFTKVLRNVAHYTSKKSRKKANGSNSAIGPTTASGHPQETDINAPGLSEPSLPSADNEPRSAVADENTIPITSTARNSGNELQHADTSVEISRPSISQSQAITEPNAAPSVQPDSSTANAETSSFFDGFLRVRVCTVKACHNPIPLDYFWKMCYNCRIAHRAWSQTKRARFREKQVRESLGIENHPAAEQDSSSEEEDDGTHEKMPFDPYVAPRPCSRPGCKHHVVGSLRWKRCDFHREISKNSYYRARKREDAKDLWRKAIKEGLDVEEALRAWLEQEQAAEEASAESTDIPLFPGDDSHTRRTGEAPKRTARPQLSIAKRMEGIHICGGKSCANLMNPEVPWRLCEHCRSEEYNTRTSKPPAAHPDEEPIPTFHTISNGAGSSSVDIPGPETPTVGTPNQDLSASSSSNGFHSFQLETRNQPTADISNGDITMTVFTEDLIEIAGSSMSNGETSKSGTQAASRKKLPLGVNSSKYPELDGMIQNGVLDLTKVPAAPAPLKIRKRRKTTKDVTTPNNENVNTPSSSAAPPIPSPAPSHPAGGVWSHPQTFPTGIPSRPCCTGGDGSSSHVHHASYIAANPAAPPPTPSQSQSTSVQPPAQSETPAGATGKQSLPRRPSKQRTKNAVLGTSVWKPSLVNYASNSVNSEPSAATGRYSSSTYAALAAYAKELSDRGLLTSTESMRLANDSQTPASSTQEIPSTQSSESQLDPALMGVPSTRDPGEVTQRSVGTTNSNQNDGSPSSKRKTRPAESDDEGEVEDIVREGVLSQDANPAGRAI